jgi:hypothetical protein
VNGCSIHKNRESSCSICNARPDRSIDLILSSMLLLSCREGTSILDPGLRQHALDLAHEAGVESILPPLLEPTTWRP